ncbi:MAG: hypothetical protein HKN85_03410 [Gammaproteobacteria bacterium]|nr:hypothetical protein [Gammaproteobacteria bacterium]
MNQQKFLSELEQSCDIFRDSYVLRDESLVQQRDELVAFAKATVKADIVPQSESQHLLASLRKDISYVAVKTDPVAA